MSLYIPSCPTGEALSEDFRFTADGLDVPVKKVRVSAMPFNTWWPGHQRPTDQTEFASYANFSLDGRVHIEITCLTRRAENVELRPSAYGITPQVEGRVISFDLDKPCHFTVELDGPHKALHVFVSDPEHYDVKLDDPHTRYFPAGIHKADLIELSSNDTLYLDEGAVVYGSIFAKNAENIRILGRGVIDSSPYLRGCECTGRNRPGEEVTSALRAKRVGNSIGNVLLVNCKNVLIDGVIFRDPPEWSFNVYHCENVRLHDIKLIGLWRYNADGIDIHLGKHFEISDSFIRSFDDSIVARGACGILDEDVFEDMRVKNCVLWCDWGRALEIGAETCAPTMSDIRFQNCHIIHGDAVMMDVQHGDRAELSNISFENITAEYTSKAMAGKLQTEKDEVYVNANDAHMPQLFVVMTIHTMWSNDDVTGNISDVRFKNIHVLSEDGRIPSSHIDAVADNTSITDVIFEDIFVNGVKQTDKSVLHLEPPKSKELPVSCIVDGEAPKKGGVVKNVVLR